MGALGLRAVLMITQPDCADMSERGGEIFYGQAAWWEHAENVLKRVFGGTDSRHAMTAATMPKRIKRGSNWLIVKLVTETKWSEAQTLELPITLPHLSGADHTATGRQRNPCGGSRTLATVAQKTSQPGSNPGLSTPTNGEKR